VLIGAAALAAEYNGVAGASHIKDKLIEMTHLNETIYSSALACSYEGAPTPSGAYLIDLLLANVCKQNVTRFPYEMCRLAEDIAGGLMVTQPSEKDFRSEAVGHYIEKYLRGVDSVPTEHRLRIMRLIENLTLGTESCGLSYRIHAWSRISAGAKDHDQPAGKYRTEKGTGQEHCKDQIIAGAHQSCKMKYFTKRNTPRRGVFFYRTLLLF
jgi:aromatic ring hydroxylase